MGLAERRNGSQRFVTAMSDGGAQTFANNLRAHEKAEGPRSNSPRFSELAKVKKRRSDPSRFPPGYVSPATACLIGLIAGGVCLYAVELKNKLQWDDALDVWGAHGVGGFLGIVLCGIFATTVFNPVASTAS